MSSKNTAAETHDPADIEYDAGIILAVSQLIANDDVITHELAIRLAGGMRKVLKLKKGEHLRLLTEEERREVKKLSRAQLEH